MPRTQFACLLHNANCIMSDLQEALCDEDMANLDSKDPNRPRFTLQELRDVLHERNELKAKVFMLQEEIAYYKRQTHISLLTSHLESRSTFRRE